MPSVYRKGGKWWGKIKGYKEPGVWSALPTPYKCRPKPDDWNKAEAQRWVEYGQKKTDARAALLGPQGPLTAKNYAESWLEEPSRKALKSWPEMRGHLRNHVLPIIGDKRMIDIQEKELRDLLRQLKQKPNLSPKTVLNVYGTLRTMLHDAKTDRVIASVPEVDRSELPEKIDKDPEWRELATYERAEVVTILTSTKIPPERRVQYALKALAGLRHGEVAGLRWRMWLEMEPLQRLSVARTYQDQTTKTKVPRPVPVHPELRRMLEAWEKLWPEVYGDEPTPDDFIVPTRFRTPVDPDDAVVAFKVDLHELGLRVAAGEHRDRGGHDLRAWFISTAIEDGADVAILQRVTHTKKKDVVSGYTRLPWHVLCREVAKLKIELGPDPLPLGTDELPRLVSYRRAYYKRGLARRSKATPTGFEPVSTSVRPCETPVIPPDSGRIPTSHDVSLAAMVASLGTSPRGASDPSDQPPADDPTTDRTRETDP